MSKLAKIIITALLTAAAVTASAQRDTVVTVYHLDYIRQDSFFLEITDSVFTSFEARPAISRRYVFFQDTADFRQYINNAKTEYEAIDRQRLAIARQFFLVDYKVKRMECLMDSVVYSLNCSGIGARAVQLPPVEMRQDVETKKNIPQAPKKTKQKPKGRNKNQ